MPLSDLAEIRHKISAILHIEHLHLLHVKEGCIELTFKYFTKSSIAASIDDHKQNQLKRIGYVQEIKSCN